MSRSIRSVVVAAAAFAATGCADYAYRAGTTANAATAQAEYSVPKQAPRGKVSLRSPGIEPLPASTHQTALHVVMTVANRGAIPWHIDTRRDPVIALPDGNRRQPELALVNGMARGPIVDVPPGATRTVDLYYSLPSDEARSRWLPSFSAHWELETGCGPLGGETTFQRVNVSGPTMPCGAQASAYCLAGYGA